MNIFKKISLFFITVCAMAALCMVCEKYGKQNCLKEMESTPVLMAMYYKYVTGEIETCDSWFHNFQNGVLHFKQSNFLNIEYLIYAILLGLNFKILTRKYPARLLIDKNIIVLKMVTQSRKQKRLTPKYSRIKYPGSNAFKHELLKSFLTLELEKQKTDTTTEQQTTPNETEEDERVDIQQTEGLSWLDMTQLPIPDEFWDEILDFS